MIVLLLACHWVSPSTDSGSADTSGTSGTSAPVDRGPTSIPVDGVPNGVWWDAGTSTLIVADDANNRLLRWSDADGLSAIGALSSTIANPGLGQVVRLDDGRLVVPRFGFGTNGDVAVLAADGTASAVSGLDPARRRIGVTAMSDGTLYDTWFTQGGAGQVGAIGRLNLDGTETAVVSDLLKPVGVVQVGGQLYAADQFSGDLLSVDVDQGTATSIATVPDCDLLAAGPNATILTATKDGSVVQIGADGSTSTLLTVQGEATSSGASRRGLAYDDINHRLFLAHHDETGTADAILIEPVDP